MLGALGAVPIATVGMPLSALRSSATGASPLDVAVIAPFTGAAAEFGQLSIAPCKAATYLIDRAGGVLGHRLNCLPVNDYGDPADAVPALEKVFATNTSILMAQGLETNTAATTVPLVERQHLPFITANGLTAYDTQTNPYFYRMSPSDDQNGAAYAVAAHELGFNRVAVIYANNIGASGNIPGTLSAIKKLHMTMTTNILLPSDQTSYSSTVQRIIAGKPQALIFYAGPKTTGTFLTNYEQLSGQKLPPFVTASASVAPDFVTALQKVVSKSYLTHDIYFVGQGIQPHQPAFVQFDTGMKATGAPARVLGNGVLASLYDGVILLSLAADQAHSTVGSVYNKDVVTVATARPGAQVVHTYAAGLAALKAGHQIEYVGTAGVIHFNAYHNFVSNWGVERLTAAGATSQYSSIPGSTVLQEAS